MEGIFKHNQHPKHKMTSMRSTILYRRLYEHCLDTTLPQHNTMLRTLLSQSSRSLQTRSLHSTRPALSLQNIFETSDRPSLTIAKLTPKGFHLSDDLVVPGGLVLAGYQALLWDVDPPKGDGSGDLQAAWKGWTKERFQVFESVVPRPGMSARWRSNNRREADKSRDFTIWNWPDGDPRTQGD